jgi:lipopolysaccharide export system protein LptA
MPGAILSAGERENEMMKRIGLVLAVAGAGVASGFAQEMLTLERKPGAKILDDAPREKAGAEPEKAGEKPSGTEITSTSEASFDEKARKATFVGDVQVKDPEFTMTSERLTAFLRRSAVDNGGAKQEKPAGDSGGEKAGKADDQADKTDKAGKASGALERAVAEGNVVFVRETVDESGEKTRSTGKAQRAEFDGDSGDVTLIGWPQVQQGINTHVAAEESTVMVINRDGRMKTRGRSRTVIQEDAEPGAKKP